MSFNSDCYFVDIQQHNYMKDHRFLSKEQATDNQWLV